MGALSWSTCGRVSIHAESPQSYSGSSTTTLAVPGGTSVAKANGSAFKIRRPSDATISNLYLAPFSTPGTNSSHTPDDPSERMGCTRPSQKFQSPTTRTDLAFGAHTANDVPSTPWWQRWWAPSTVHSDRCRPSPNRCRSSSPSVGHAL